MRDDLTLLLDMLIAARKVQRFVADLDAESFQRSELHQSAVVRELQIIGEAAWQVSDGYKAANAEIDWQKIAGMRHRLVHEYFRISLEIVWRTIEEEVPALVEQLEKLVPPDAAGD
jgi:uncharacterized protein with HEPN domain